MQQRRPSCGPGWCLRSGQCHAGMDVVQVKNFDNDVILAEACYNDVEDFCSEVAPGDGRVHQCLRKRRSELSDRCAKEELKLEIQESQNFDLRVNLKKARRLTPALLRAFFNS